MRGCLISLIIFCGSMATRSVVAEGSSDDASLIAWSAVQGLEFETGLASGQNVVLRGRDARWQLLVTARDVAGASHDATHEVTYTAEPSDIVQIGSTGLAVPLQAGAVTVTATSPSGLHASQRLEVVDFDSAQPVNFANQVVPIFTKLGCNGGGCHGKAAGQNGFRLSLLGFEPQDDYEFLVRESRGRRLFPAFPDRSLLLTKAVAGVPHGGGQRMEEDSYEYRLLRRWIAQGMPYGSDADPRVTQIQVVPRDRLMTRKGRQQLMVLARYSDGQVEDVTTTAQYESNDPEMADVDERGLVRIGELAGDVTVMARYQGEVAVFRATLPLSDQPPELPHPRNLVDEAVFAKLRQLGIPASPRCDDATFIRRVTLDLAGRLPEIEETQEFVADPSPEKRDAWIERLLASEDHAEYFAGKWSNILRNRRNNDAYKYGSFAFHHWIQQQIYHNRPYDEFVREIVAASGSLTVHPPVAWYRQVSDVNQQVEDTAQLFLGQRIQCARCHHHPFEKWSQQDYSHLAAFFSLVSRKEGRSPEEPVIYSRLGRATAADPKSGAALPPAGLGAEPLDLPETIDPRQRLVDWMADSENPYFAPALVNRYWKHFFGRGLVDPEDDLRVTNPASNPQLLDGLSRHFIESDFDMRGLMRMICQSETYQFSSDANELNLSDRRNHSRFYPKRLPAEVLLDAIDSVLDTTTAFDEMPAGTRAVSLPDTNFNSYFLTVFGRPEAATACECERAMDANLAQSLHLLNSKEMQGKLADEQGRAARCAASVNDETNPPIADHEVQQIETFYLRALSRPPKPQELRDVLDFIASREDRRAAYEDVLWALVNSKEFLFNH